MIGNLSSHRNGSLKVIIEIVGNMFGVGIKLTRAHNQKLN